MDPPAEPKSKWPDNWRDLMAGDLADTATDEEKTEHGKLLKRLQRFTTPADAAKALREQDKIIPLAKRAAPPKNATPEQLSEWRKEAGIPEKPEDYKIELPKGMVLGDNDKPIIDGFIKAMHGQNVTEGTVNAAVAWYLQDRQEQIERMQESDKAYRDALEEDLRETWGSDYKANKTGIESLVNQWPEDVRTALLSARTADGFLIENPGMMKVLGNLSRELGYVGSTVVPSGGDLGASVEDAIAKIEGSMFLESGEKNPAYWKSEKQQTRYAELLSQRERMNKQK